MIKVGDFLFFAERRKELSFSPRTPQKMSKKIKTKDALKAQKFL